MGERKRKKWVFAGDRTSAFGLQASARGFIFLFEVGNLRECHHFSKQL
jgi:hypothetical protein